MKNKLLSGLLIIGILLCFMCVPAYAEGKSITGTITENMVWNDGDVIDGVTLSGNVTITVKGTVTVTGTIRLSPDAISNVTFNGENDAKLIRGSEFTGQMFYAEGVSGSFQNLTFNNITLDGGAVWTGDVDKTLNRGKTNEGVKATGSVLYLLYANADLNNSTLQNHDDAIGEKANAVFLRYYSTIDFNDSVVRNNNSVSSYYRGGVITVRQGGTVKTNNAEVYGNSSVKGGFYGTSSTGSYGGVVEAYNSKFHNNYADNGSVFDMQCNSNRGYLLIDGCEFYENASNRGLIYEHAYSRPVTIKDSYFHDNECAVWDCHTDPVLDISGKIVITEDADYTGYLFETPFVLTGPLAEGSSIAISEASLVKLGGTFVTGTADYTVTEADLAKFDLPEGYEIFIADTTGDGVGDVVAMEPTDGTTVVTLTLKDSAESEASAEASVYNNIACLPVNPFVHEGLTFNGWVDADGNAVAKQNFTEPTTLTATWKIEAPVVKLSRADASDPYCNTLLATVTNKYDTIVYTYQWYKADVAIEGATSETYTITETASYKCVVTASVEGFEPVTGEKSGSASLKVAPVAKIGKTGYETVAAAFEAATNGATVELIADTYEDVKIPAEFTGTLAIGTSELNSITNNSATATIVINGDVVVNNANGSAITGEVINISGTGKLTAIANGDHSYGIGGDNTKSINIENVHILNVQGGHVQPMFVNDPSYGKTEPEGGAAIGSGYNGAVITLKNVTIDEALGGSKAAGIGARYWTGVTINITDCNIAKVEGGNASAGIGGSRVSEGATDTEKITINILNSTITAKGGQAGAGIGSGYDTHCQTNQPICTINIDGSTINATGGKYAAGIGTGFHNAGLAGEIKNSEVTAVPGEKVYKDKYTSAQDIGFGVADLTREGSNNNSCIIYNGTKITLPGYVAQIGETKYPTFKVAIAEANKAEGGATVTLLDNITLGEKLTISVDVTISGAYTITRADNYTGTLFTVNAGATLTLDGGLVIDGNNNWTLNTELYNKALNREVSGVTWEELITTEENAPNATAAMFVVNGSVVANNVTIQNNYSTKDSNGGDGGIFKVEANATLTMTGATVKHIVTHGANSVAHLSTNAVWTMNDGTLITDTFAGKNGGVCRNDSGKFVMTGGTIEKNNSINTNGTVVMLYKGSMEMNGGKICSNTGISGTANGRCAPIYGHSTSTFIMTSGEICHNTGISYGGVDVPSSIKVEISGGYIGENISSIGNTNKDVNGNSNTVITGGTFTQDVRQWCASDSAIIFNEETGKYEVYEDSHIVTWSVDGVERLTVCGDELRIAKPSAPQKTGHTFAGWYTDSELTDEWNFETDVVTDDITLYANWTIKRYTITFNTAGGSAIAPITQDYGSLVAAPTAPTKEGYTFAGWYTEIPETMPAENITITAQWEPANLTGTVTISGTPKVGETLTATLTDTNNTGTLSYQWYRHTESSVLIDGATERSYSITEDDVDWALYCVVNSSEQTGNVNSGYVGPVPRLQFPEGAVSAVGFTGEYDGETHSITVTAPEGCRIYYSTNGEDYSEENPEFTEVGTYTVYYRVGKDKYASVEGSEVVTITEVTTFTVTWNVDGNETTETYERNETPAYPGTPVKAPDPQYTYTFTGWDKELAPVTGDVTYTAQFSATVNKYSVTFVDEDGTTVLKAAAEYDYGTAADSIAKPETPVKEGNKQYSYSFAGWTPAVAKVTADATYKATYTATVNKYVVKFLNEDGTVLQATEVAYGETPVYGGETPAKAADAKYSYTFKSWDKELAAVSGEATYTATYTPAANDYTISYELNGGSAVGNPNGYNAESADIVLNTPTRQGYTFAGWTFDGQDEPVLSVTIAAGSTGDRSFTANWTANVNTVTFDPANGEDTFRRGYETDRGYALPAAPEKAGHTFSGWQLADGTVYAAGDSFVTKSDAEFTALWTINSYTVTFDSNGGSEVAPVTAVYGSTIAEPEAPANAMFLFVGWYLDDMLTEKFDFDTSITEDITLYAAWYYIAPTVPEEPDEPVVPDVPEESEEIETPDIPGSPAVENPFTDVKATDYFYDAVMWAVSENITNGVSDTLFGPHLHCTRAQIITFLWRAAGCPEPVGRECEFDDVGADAYYYKAVLWAVENGITSGVSDTAFAPDATCTRAQIVTFLYRFEDAEGGNAANPFVDVAEGAYYFDSVLWAVENGITDGMSETTFAPADECTRAQAVVFLYRSFSK